MTRSFKWMWAICISLLFIPTLVDVVPWVRITPLRGTENSPNTADSSGRWQEAINRHANAEFAMRAPFIRLRNQIDYSLFRKTHAGEVVLGKRQTLFHRASLGGNLAPGADQRVLQKRIQSLKSLRDTLYTHGIPLQILIAPGKRNFHAADLPKNSQKTHPSERILEKLWGAGLPLIELSDTFLQAPLPDSIALFPKLGLHWTPYASALSLHQALRKSGHQKLADQMNIGPPEPSNLADDQERDLWDMLNLTIPFSTWPVHRAQINFSGNPEPKRLLVIGDSFFIDWMDEGWIQSCFSHSELLFYGRFIFEGDVSKGSVYTDSLDLPAYLFSFDEIWMMAHEDNLEAFPFGFESHIARAFP